MTHPTNGDLPAKSESAAKVLSSEELFRGATEIFVLHNGELYRLRITRNGKLLLTK